MDAIAVFAVIAGIVILGYVAEFIFRSTNIPDVLLLIGIGILIGSVLNWADPRSFGFGSELFTTFALVFILFQGALSLDIKALIRSLSDTFALTLLNFIITVSVIGLISYYLGYDLLTAILIGTILGGTSSAVVIPLVRNLPVSERHSTVLTLESVISDVFCIVGAITVLEIIETGKIVASGIFNSVLSSFSLALVVGFAVGLVWIILLNKYESLERSYLMTIAIVIGLYAFVESAFVNASGPVAALAFGLVLGNSKTILSISATKRKKHGEEDTGKNVLLPSAKNFYSEISFFVKTFFFVYLGLLFDFSNPQALLYGLILTLATFIMRPITVWAVYGKAKFENMERVFLEIMMPKGLAAAVLAGIAVQSGLLGAELSAFVNMILSVVFFSILFTSTLIFFTHKGWFRGFIPFIHPRVEFRKEEN